MTVEGGGEVSVSDPGFEEEGEGWEEVARETRVAVEKEGVVDSCGTVYVEIEGKRGDGVDELDWRRARRVRSRAREEEERKTRRGRGD